MNDASLIKRRQMGAYETPIMTASYMVRQLLPHLKPGSKVLDPAAGGGVFIRQLIEHGISPDSIIAWDTDPNVLPLLHKLTPNAQLHDGLASGTELFDAIIGNPPYNSHECDYIHQNHEWLQKEYQEIGLYNLYAIFTVNMVRHLREGGVACLIVMDSFLTNKYHRRFRQFLLEHCKIHEILLAPRRLFHRGKADVRTAILTLELCSDPAARAQNQMRLVDRISDETSYIDPPRIQYLLQQDYWNSRELRFHLCIPSKVIELVNHPPLLLSDIVEGGAGISTGNDALFLKKKEEVEGDPNWVPFYKNSGKRAYLTETDDRINRDWKQSSKTSKTFLTRNSAYYFKEGISCSSMGVRFSACYLPSGCLFGVNANLFLKSDRSPDELFYLLGYLNSSLVQYILRAVLNRTNMATPGYVKELPYIEPDSQIKEEIADLVKQIIVELKKDPQFDYGPHQRTINLKIFDLYQIPPEAQPVIQEFSDQVLERL
jgi:hypothetical protein